MQDAWDKWLTKLSLGGQSDGRKRHDASQRKTVQAVGWRRNHRNLDIVWTAPINLAAKQLELPNSRPRLLGVVYSMSWLKMKQLRTDYQWCYYGETNLLINRVSTLDSSPHLPIKRSRILLRGDLYGWK